MSWLASISFPWERTTAWDRGRFETVGGRRPELSWMLHEGLMSWVWPWQPSGVPNIDNYLSFCFWVTWSEGRGQPHLTNLGPWDEVLVWSEVFGKRWPIIPEHKPRRLSPSLQKCLFHMYILVLSLLLTVSPVCPQFFYLFSFKCLNKVSKDLQAFKCFLGPKPQVCPWCLYVLNRHPSWEITKMELP